MNINKVFNDNTLTITIDGRLDTITAPELEKALSETLSNVKKLIFDFGKLQYISSAGLRVILSAQKIMNKQGEMKILNVSKPILEILEVTGFADIMTIE